MTEKDHSFSELQGLALNAQKSQKQQGIQIFRPRAVSLGDSTKQHHSECPAISQNLRGLFRVENWLSVVYDEA